MRHLLHPDARDPQAQGRQLLFEWQLDVQRLEREAKAAALSGQAFRSTGVEAECSLDLIDAELTALRNHPDAADSIIELRSWKARIERVLRQLAAAGGQG